MYANPADEAIEPDSNGHSLGPMHDPGNTFNTVSTNGASTDSHTDAPTDDLEIFTACERYREESVVIETGEYLPPTYCDRLRCAVCAERQCKRLARIAAWSLEDAPYVYLLTLTPVERETWQERRKAMLREARVAGRRVEMLSVVEQELQTHVHAVLWTSHPLKLTNSVDNTLKKVGSSYVDRYNAAYYLTKTVHRDNNLSQHLELNKRHLASWTGGFFYGYSGFKDARRGYVEEKAWLKS